MPLPHERPLPAFHRACQWGINASARAIWGFRISGLEHVPAAGPLIIAGNHSCWVDAPLLFCAVSSKRPVTFLAKAELFSNRLLSWFFTRGWSIPLDRRGDVSAMRGAVEVLEGGGCLALFPQGTRAHPGRDPKLKPGLGFLAALGRAPVVPARLVNMDRFPFGRPLEIRFGPSLEFSGDPHSREECVAFAGRVMARIFEL